MRMAETNAERMAIQSPIGGMAVLKSIWKSNTMAEVQEGEEVRAGVPIVDIVNPNAMRVRARVNQADINELRVGQPVRVGLDAYPDLHFRGKVAQISPLGVMSNAVAEGARVHRADRRRGLAPEPDAGPHRVARRRAVAHAGGAGRAARRDRQRRRARVRQRAARSGFEDREVTLGAMNAHEVVVASGARRRRRRRAQRGSREAAAMSRFSRLLRRPRNIVTDADRRHRGRCAGAFAAVRRTSDAGPADRRSEEGRVRRHARDPRRHQAAASRSCCRRRCSRASCRSSSWRRTARRSRLATSSCSSTARLLQRTIQEKQSELRQADAEIEQARAQGKITEEQNATALMKARYDIERAKLDVEQGRHRLAHREREGQAGAGRRASSGCASSRRRSSRTGPRREADVAAQQRKREKALFDLQRAERGLQNLELRAPAAGIVNILPNFRAASTFGGSEQEFREGDRAWPGAAILELPDLSSVHLEARLDESDRGRLKVGQDATVRIEAIPGREFKARINDISVLASVDFTLGLAAAEELRPQSRS